MHYGYSGPRLLPGAKVTLVMFKTRGDSTRLILTSTLSSVNHVTKVATHLQPCLDTTPTRQKPSITPADTPAQGKPSIRIAWTSLC
jgi:hypothetical protein